MAAVGDLSVFLPAHDEVDNLERTVAQAVAAVEGLALRSAEVIVVDDGSTDGTAALADDLAARHDVVSVVHHDRNRGYGAALRTGFATASCEWVFFMDADGQFDVGELALLVAEADAVDAVLGYRIRRADNAVRRLNTWAWHRLVRATVGLRVRDVDCGFKLLRRRCLEKLPPLTSDGAVISTELLIKWRDAGFTWREVGVHHYPRVAGEASGADPRVVARAAAELVRLRRERRG